MKMKMKNSIKSKAISVRSEGSRYNVGLTYYFLSLKPNELKEMKFNIKPNNKYIIEVTPNKRGKYEISNWLDAMDEIVVKRIDTDYMIGLCGEGLQHLFRNLKWLRKEPSRYSIKFEKVSK